MICENCGREHNGIYGSGRFCSSFCSHSFVAKNISDEANKRRINGLRKGAEKRKAQRKAPSPKAERKRVSAEFPYDNYYIYIVHHEKENRRYAVLISKEDHNKRTTVSYARYLLSVKLGRKLEKWEQVDHIDNDKTNDVIENLQILTVRENNQKEAKRKGRKMVLLKCPMCKVEFSKRRGQSPLVKSKGNYTCCCKECSNDFKSLLFKKELGTFVEQSIKENIIKEYIQY